jgi:hypothetical protein
LLRLRGADNTKIEYTFRAAVGMQIAFMYSVFHRILDLKTGWISIRAFFFVPTSTTFSPDRFFSLVERFFSLVGCMAGDEEAGGVGGGVVLEEEAFAGGEVGAGCDDIVEEDDIGAEWLCGPDPGIIVYEFIDGRAFVLAFVCCCVVFATEDRLADIGIGWTGQA